MKPVNSISHLSASGPNTPQGRSRSQGGITPEAGILRVNRMIYELINPSDSYTFYADDPKVAVSVALLVGSGKMGLEDETGNGDYPAMQLFCDADVVEKKLTQYFGQPWGDWMKGHRVEIADALETVITLGRKERHAYDEALKRIDDPVKREAYRVSIHDKNCTSLSDFGTYAWKLAKRLRE